MLYICKRIQLHRDLLLSPIREELAKLLKRVAKIDYANTLQRREIDSIKRAIKALIAQRSCKRKYIRTEEALIVSKVQDLIAK